MEVDWPACDERLHAVSVAAIRRFAAEHPDEPICYFAFDSEPRYGYVLLSFDTLANNIRSARKREQFAIGQRQKRLTRDGAWKHAKYYLHSPVLAPFNTNSGAFAYPEYAKAEFPEWQQLAEQGGYPASGPHEDDYLESGARLVLWRVADRLIAEGAFAPLRLASPFLVGYGVHDQEEVILRLLNWPAGTEPGAAAELARG